MGFYLFIIAILILFSLLNPVGTKGRNLLILSIIFLYAIASLRSVSIGNDTLGYAVGFADIVENGNNAVKLSWNETGYSWLNRLIAMFTDDFNAFLAVVNAIIYFSFYKLIRNYSPNYGLSLLLFLCFGYWGNTVNIIRQELAVSIFIYAYLLAESGRKVRGLVTGVMAPLFQKTSLVYFLYFLIPRKIDKRFYVMSGSVAVVIVLKIDKAILLVTKFFSGFGSYLKENSKYVIGRVEPAVVVKCAFLLFVWALALYVYDRNKDSIENDIERTAIVSQINMVFMAFLIMMTATRFNLLDRCAMFFNIFVIILIPNIIEMIRKDEFRHIVRAAFTVVAVVYFVAVNVFRPEWNHIYPYRMFFQAVK